MWSPSLPSIPTTVSATIAVGGALLLLTASVEHLLHFTRLRAALIAQRVVPYRLHRTLAVGLVGVEFGIGSGACVAVLTVPFVGQTVFFAEACLYGLFVGYLTFLRLGRGRVPCGCFGDEPVRAQILVRAGVFAVAAAAAAVLATDPLVTLSSVPLMGAALVVAVAARVLPGMSSRRI